MSITNSLHYELCCKAATWVRQPQNSERWHSPYQLSTVELVCTGMEVADVYATNGEISCVIEVKTSHRDFDVDSSKYTRYRPDEGLGDYRYYLCPNGTIKEDELPPYWGLLYYNDDGKIVKVKHAIPQTCNKRAELFVLMSIMRREGMLNKTYNFRQQKFK